MLHGKDGMVYDGCGVDYLHLGKRFGLLWGVYLQWRVRCLSSMHACFPGEMWSIHSSHSRKFSLPPAICLFGALHLSQHYPLLCKNHFESNKMVALVARPCLTSDLTSANCNWEAVMRKNNP
jgi:hypothetical protein